MYMRAFTLSVGLIVIVLAGSHAAIAQVPAAPPVSGEQYGYVTKVPSPASMDAAMPQILEIDVNAEQLSAPGPIALRVLTSPNVAAVSAHIEGETIGIPASRAGEFQLEAMLPTLATYMKGKTYNLDFEATTADGKQTHVQLPIMIRP